MPRPPRSAPPTSCTPCRPPSAPSGPARPDSPGQGTRHRLAHLEVMDAPLEAVINLATIRQNTAALGEHVGGAQVMAVVKADGYGHGMVQAARAALAGGASWLGVTTVAEAVVLREAGVGGRVLALLDDPEAAH